MLYMVTIFFALYIIFDVNYFLRIIFTVIWAKFIKQKVKLMSETTIYGICTTQDLDLICSHMNNARYPRNLDFARFDNLIRNNVFDEIRKMGITAVVSGLYVRYRQPISFLMVYKIATKIIHWDEKHLYFEHKFINPRNNFIHTIIFVKTSLIGMKIPLTEFMVRLEPGIHLPEITKDFKSWLESMEYSSQILKKN